MFFMYLELASTNGAHLITSCGREHLAFSALTQSEREHWRKIEERARVGERERRKRWGYEIERKRNGERRMMCDS